MLNILKNYLVQSKNNKEIKAKKEELKETNEQLDIVLKELKDYKIEHNIKENSLHFGDIQFNKLIVKRDNLLSRVQMLENILKNFGGKVL